MAQTRNETNPLYNTNKLKLGTFGTNVSGGCSITTAPEALETTWDNTLDIAQAADRLGLEAFVPVARWKGFGGESNFNGTCYETYTWAAGIAQATKNAAVFTTSHVPTVHPIMAAKQAVTVDHISRGRFALNIVCGWFAPELEMFGAPIMEHDTRYDYAAEWIEIMKLLWTREEEFDYEGKFLHVKKGFAQPKPVQRPFPPLMNAGSSGKGREFAAKYADMVFVSVSTSPLDDIKALIASYKELARREYGREIQVWSNAHITQRDTMEEAEKVWRYFVVEKGDDAALDQLMGVQRSQSQRLLTQIEEQRRLLLKGGWGGHKLVGTPDHIVEGMKKLSDIGFDGVLLSWLDYKDGIARWEKDVAPRLVQAGLRH
jgi:alkanesulfonate monooxygenase SsuD/methylene tetrahydromethanopterin reductase-like flavin-dependent oxidoreductase (luciferase family)